MRSKILVKRGFLEINKPDKDFAYLAAGLINHFGVVVDKVGALSMKNYETIADFYGKHVPVSFYSNPQDLKYFTVEELIIEQIVSYLKIDINGVNSLDDEVFKRNEVFAKALPNYKVGGEIKLRKYKMISKAEADEVLKNIAVDLCKYSRPWSVDETAEMKWLYLNGYYDNQPLLCRDNASVMFLEYKIAHFAKMLDKKDIVKMSLNEFGYKKRFSFSDDDKTIFSLAVRNASDCPLTIKQAKYYNSILKKLGVKTIREDNSKSPYKKAINLIKNNDIVEAAKVFAENGSLLERNLVFLLSRANLEQADEIVKMIKSKNPVVLIQILLGIVNDDYSTYRVFTFYNNRKLKSHTETEEERKYRKSILSIGIKNFLIDKLNDIIREYYTNQPSLGKIYIGECFKRIAPPLNTSAMGMGLDILPTGSRVDIKSDNIRTFCHWEKAFDIDSSVIFVHGSGKRFTSYWGNFSAKLLGDSALSSGDIRGMNGTEYYDFKVKELKEMGYKYAVYTLYGYNSTLDAGEIYCGYQNKDDLNTEAWDPKNIELKIHVKGKSRGYIGFALDLENNEVVIINQTLDTQCNVADEDLVDSVLIYLKKNYLDNFNMYKLLSYRGEIVDNKEDADIVFDIEYEPKENQQLISPYNIEKLVNLLK